MSPSPYPLSVVAKLNETNAPTSSCPGTTAEGAIKWLLLKDTKGLSQGGIDTVYRIETAGGNKPATCKGQKPAFEVKYSAQCTPPPPLSLSPNVLQITDTPRLDLRPQEPRLRRLDLERRAAELLAGVAGTAQLFRQRGEQSSHIECLAPSVLVYLGAMVLA